MKMVLAVLFMILGIYILSKTNSLITKLLVIVVLVIIILMALGVIDGFPRPVIATHLVNHIS